MTSLDSLQQTFANKSHAYWATRRTELSLIERSIKTSETTHTQFISELSDILESGKLTYPPILNRLGISPEDSLKTKKAILGLRSFEPNYTEDQLKLIRHMKDSNQNTREANWKWRIANAAEEYQQKAWYPFFVTLTIDPNNHDAEAIWKEGRALRKYIRKLCNVVTHELGHRPAHRSNIPESEYIAYVGVIEHGKSRAHHHGHFIIWMREIPASWKLDPNRGIRNPAARNKRECEKMRTFWEYSLPGLSPALYFRSIGDVWSQLGHIVPMQKGEAIHIGTPRQSGGYLCKYMGKDHKEWRHRTKATRNLGRTRLIQTIKSLTDQQVEALTWRPSTYSLNHSLKTIHTVPLGLLRQLAKQEHYLRQFRRNRLDLKTLTKKSSETFQNMLQNVLAGTRPDRMDSQQYYDWVGQFLPAVDGYCDQRLIGAHKKLSDTFPINHTRIKRITIPGNTN